jgi:hypothetical protein
VAGAPTAMHAAAAAFPSPFLFSPRPATCLAPLSRTGGAWRRPPSPAGAPPARHQQRRQPMAAWRSLPASPLCVSDPPVAAWFLAEETAMDRGLAGDRRRTPRQWTAVRPLPPEGFFPFGRGEASPSTAHGFSSPSLHWMRTGIERNRRGRRRWRSLPASPRLKSGEFFSPFLSVMFDSGFFWGC